jgi:hypothetical protein
MRTDLRKLSKKARPHFYRQKQLIHKIWYLYPDHTYRLEIEPCVWNEGTSQERKGWPACSGQLTCPFVNCERSDHEQSPLGHCNQECRDNRMKEAIEAWITLNPNIM